MCTAQTGFTGLAVMDLNIARNFTHLHRCPAQSLGGQHRCALEAHGSEGDFVRSGRARNLAALEKPRRVIIMVKAADPTDAVINEVAEAMEPGDIIIDRGKAPPTPNHPPREGPTTGPRSTLSCGACLMCI
jgi:6-phosphogluconate dehydrogenase